MKLVKSWTKKPIPLHALEPDETLHERIYWLTLFVKQLKAERDELQQQNKMLLMRANDGQPLTVEEQELLELRDQVNHLWKTNAKLTKRLKNLGTKATHLKAALDEANQREEAA